MISFEMTEEQTLVRDSMREFAAAEIRKRARSADEESAVPAELLATTWSLGLTSTQLPEAFGGAGEARSCVTNAIVLEELAHGDAALAIAALSPSLFANAILDHGSEAQKKAHLPRFAGARFVTGSLAVCEPAPLADGSRPRCIAEAKNGTYVLSGRKSLVAMGDRATHFLVTAREGSELGAYIVPRDAVGLTVGPLEKNMGLRALPTTSLLLERVELPAESKLGEAGGANVQAVLDASRVALAAVMLGVSRAVLEYCVPYAKDRVAFDEAIAKKQAIAFRLADMHIEQHAMRQLVWRAASLLEHGLDATRAAWQARCYAAEKSMWIADNGVQVLGGHGFIREHPVEMWFRHARTLGVAEGLVAL
ncbi:MAG: acyl-CoA dehydrogenase family protein [Deltaproteobacteria bacterium]|nr:acyl-CoA dehydrogenase family protein [Deltaproteobacteria bacterium]